MYVSSRLLVKQFIQEEQTDILQIQRESQSLCHCVLQNVMRALQWRSWLEALRYKPEGRGFDSPMMSLEFFIDIILPVALWPLGSTQPLTEMSTRDIS
jgi:hypothetical protein